MTENTKNVDISSGEYLFRDEEGNWGIIVSGKHYFCEMRDPQMVIDIIHQLVGLYLEFQGSKMPEESSDEEKEKTLKCVGHIKANLAALKFVLNRIPEVGIPVELFNSSAFTLH